MKPNLVQLTAASHFVPGHDMDFIAYAGSEWSDAQVFPVVAVGTVVVVFKDNLCGAALPGDDLDQQIIVGVLKSVFSPGARGDDEVPALPGERTAAT
ncbi:MAG: hypothetical protein KY456_06550 [Chloroflexi bacterium]|nr:hypothetical protein [Chloroflexota bacterium]